MKRTDITALFPEATAEQIQAIMDLNGTDVNKAKGDLAGIQAQLANAQTELQQLKAGGGQAAAELQTANNTIATLQAQIQTLQQAESLRQIREKVAGEKQIPAALLTADTEEACAAQADAILSFAKGSGYPQVPDGGEPVGGTATGKDAAWQSLASQIVPQK